MQTSQKFPISNSLIDPKERRERAVVSALEIVHAAGLGGSGAPSMMENLSHLADRIEEALLVKPK